MIVNFCAVHALRERKLFKKQNCLNHVYLPEMSGTDPLRSPFTWVTMR